MTFVNFSLTIIRHPLFIYGLVFFCVIYMLNQFFQWESLSIHLSENITCPFSEENLFGYECRKTDTCFQYLKYLIFWLIFFGYADGCITRLFVISLWVRYYLFHFLIFSFSVFWDLVIFMLLYFQCLFADLLKSYPIRIYSHNIIYL